jgi:hypothetical protein
MSMNSTSQAARRARKPLVADGTPRQAWLTPRLDFCGPGQHGADVIFVRSR